MFKRFIATFILLALNTDLIAEDIFSHSMSKIHLRWKFKISKSQMMLNHRNNKVNINFVDKELFNQIKNSILKYKYNSLYIKNISFDNKNNNLIQVELKDSSINMFSFYKDKNYIIDFWLDQDEIANNKNLNKNIPILNSNKKISKDNIKPLKKSLVSTNQLKVKVKNQDVVNTIKAKAIKKPSVEYRDFRYGASFIWNNQPIIPSLKKIINIDRKKPDYFSPIKDIKFKNKDSREAHMQLTINLYRKKKWGLMYKSMELYINKYGKDKNYILNQYIKSNAIIWESIIKGDKKVKSLGINMLKSIYPRVKDYSMKKNIMKYLISYYMENENYIEAIKMSKELYVMAKDDFDYEELNIVSEFIVHFLAKLNQLEEINRVEKDKFFLKFLPKQIFLAYKVYVTAKLGDFDNVIKIFSKNKKGLAKPIEPSILYNVAEAYFSKSKYSKAIKLFDQFLVNYPHLSSAPVARLRIATSYDILGKDPKKILFLYKRAIDLASNGVISAEAKVRYVGLRCVRKINLSKGDKEAYSLLKLNKLELKSLDNNLKSLLWLVRLRYLINTNDYQKALNYLSALPILSLHTPKKRVFQADGSEIIYGMIKDYYVKGNHSKIVKLNELYGKTYISKVANDPYVNFMIGKAYLSLKFYDGFSRIYKRMERLSSTPSSNFPIWITRNRSLNNKFLLKELKLIKDINIGNLNQANSLIKNMERANIIDNKLNYYKGILSYKNNDFKKSSEYFEKYLSESNIKTIVDYYELGDFLRMYMDSIYKIGNYKRFQEISKLIWNNSLKRQNKHPYISEVKERIAYLNIEIMSESKKYLLLESHIKEFLNLYPNSNYIGRVTYLLGKSLIENNNVVKAKNILKSLLEKNNVSPYLKELVRSELTYLKLKEKII